MAASKKRTSWGNIYVHYGFTLKVEKWYPKCSVPIVHNYFSQRIFEAIQVKGAPEEYALWSR